MTTKANVRARPVEAALTVSRSDSVARCRIGRHLNRDRLTARDKTLEGSLRGCLARTRNYNSPAEHEALTKAGAHLGAHKIRPDALLVEVIERWPELSDEIKRAVLATVRISARKRRDKRD
jgi:hypothetical protein